MTKILFKNILDNSCYPRDFKDFAFIVLPMVSCAGIHKGVLVRR